MNNISFVLLTYDGASYLWNDYFRLTKKYWPEFENIFDSFYMTTESKSFTFSSSTIIKSIKLYDNSLANRLIEVLKKVRTDYVFLDIDDFWLKETVNMKKFSHALDLLNADKKIDGIGFENFRKKTKEYNNDAYFKLLMKRMFIFNLQKGIWRKETLLKLLRKNENPWEMEYYGSIRAIYYGTKVLTEIPSHNPTFSYDYGWLVVRGKFDKNIFRYFVDNESVDSNLALEIGFRENNIKAKKASIFKKIKHLFLAIFSIFRK